MNLPELLQARSSLLYFYTLDGIDAITTPQKPLEQIAVDRVILNQQNTDRTRPRPGELQS